MHQQAEFLDATHQYGAVARQTLVRALARNSEAHNCNVQMEVGQLEQEADARFSDRRNSFQKASQARTEVTSEVCRRDEQVYDIRT